MVGMIPHEVHSSDRQEFAGDLPFPLQVACHEYGIEPCIRQNLNQSFHIFPFRARHPTDYFVLIPFAADGGQETAYIVWKRFRNSLCFRGFHPSRVG